MRQLFKDFLNRYFHDEESIIFVILLIAALVVLLTLGRALAPVITAVIVAYLLQGMVNTLLRYKVSYRMAVILVYAVFVSLFMTILLLLLPQAWNQLARLINEFPRLISEGQSLLLLLPETYPNLISEQQVQVFINSMRSELAALGQYVVSYSISSIPRIISWIIFLVLVPVMVFFIMKDKDLLLSWVGNLLPRNRPLMMTVWREMDLQMANYIRGKVVEILIVGGVTYIVLVVLGINYALLLSILVGLSVVVPYIGAAVITIPIAMVAYVQWGIGPDFYTVIIAYGIIQLLDGNVLVPVIFSETVNLHPVAIVVAVLVFGGIWGLAGVFFAIPLATLIKAIINAWPSTAKRGSTAGEAP